MRQFEKISKDQYLKDFGKGNLSPEDDERTLSHYDEVEIPERGTSKSAGYDIKSPISITIPAHGQVKVPTGLKVQMEDNEVLLMLPRSSLGTKHGIVLSNTVGVIDADYYNNSDNEGHFWIILTNNSEVNYEINKGDKICQGIFVNYLTTYNDNSSTERVSGFGSTGK